MADIFTIFGPMSHFRECVDLHSRAASAIKVDSDSDSGDEGGGEPGQSSAPMDVDDDVDVDDGGDAADDEL